jgi:hypothetical protein
MAGSAAGAGRWRNDDAVRLALLYAFNFEMTG